MHILAFFGFPGLLELAVIAFFILIPLAIAVIVIIYGVRQVRLYHREELEAREDHEADPGQH
jgi:hypothetical protein